MLQLHVQRGYPGGTQPSVIALYTLVRGKGFPEVPQTEKPGTAGRGRGSCAGKTGDGARTECENSILMKRDWLGKRFGEVAIGRHGRNILISVRALATGQSNFGDSQ